MTAHIEVPGRGMYGRNASVGPYASPGEASDDYMGVDGKDYRWKHIITVLRRSGERERGVDPVGFAVQAG